MVKIKHAKCNNNNNSLWMYFKIIIECVILCVIFIWPIMYVQASVQIENMKKKWSAIRCEPQNIIYYPFVSENITEDLTHCVENIMTNSMGEYLKPLTGSFSSLTTFGTSLLNQLQSFRVMIDFIRTSMSGIVSTFFSYIIKTIVIFYKFQINIKQLLSKLVAIILAYIYLVQGEVYLGISIMEGTPGKLIKALSSKKIGHCFADTTELLLQNGQIKQISKLALGDVLVNGSIVLVTMQILNIYEEPFYLVPNGVNGNNIYVSGTHYMYDTSIQKFQIVENITHLSKKTNMISKVMYCVITNNNLIQIGNQLFWDWEDFKINPFAT